MINDVERRTRLDPLRVYHIVCMMESGDSCSSSSVSSQKRNWDSTEDTTWEDCEGTQPYLFEPYDSEASSDTDSTNESDEGQFERLQNTDW